MIKKMLGAVLDWVFDDWLRLLVAAGIWFALTVGGTLLVANANHWIETPAHWVVALVVGMHFFVLIPLMIPVVAEQIRELQDGAEAVKRQEYLRRYYEE